MVDVLARSAGEADRAALVSGGEVITYGELGYRVDARAAALAREAAAAGEDAVDVEFDSGKGIGELSGCHGLRGNCTTSNLENEGGGEGRGGEDLLWIDSALEAW